MSVLFSPIKVRDLTLRNRISFAEGIKASADTMTIAVGLITEAKQAEDIVASGKADLVALARAFLWDPRWPWRSAAELGATVEAPPPYWRSQPRGLEGLFGKTLSGLR
jgi:2,4-dienoyl-CoA reductase-like NADH-dependent reductase (Old Yellow Enzyme family)